MTFSDMVLAHSIIERIGIDAACELISVLDGEADMTAEVAVAARLVRRLMVEEIGQHVRVVEEISTALRVSSPNLGL